MYGKEAISTARVYSIASIVYALFSSKNTSITESRFSGDIGYREHREYRARSAAILPAIL